MSPKQAYRRGAQPRPSLLEDLDLEHLGRYVPSRRSQWLYS